MRHSECWSCGGVKRLPSPNAFIYCDYCASLIDYDTSLVINQPKSAAAEAQQAQLEAQMRTVRDAGDRATHTNLKAQYFAVLLDARPQSFPHRIADPAFRADFIRYSAMAGTVMDFDEQCRQLQEREENATRAFFLHGDGTWVGFWKVVDARSANTARASQAWADAGLIDVDPDHVPQEVRTRLSMTGWVQSWIPRMPQDTAAELVARTGLTNTYIHVEPVTDGTSRHCGVCGSEFIAVPGAHAAICDHCGHRLDVGAAEFECPGCGGMITAPSGVSELSCPHCHTEVERVHI